MTRHYYIVIAQYCPQAVYWLLLLFAFVFSGLPMWSGEKARNKRERERKASSKPERRTQYRRETW